MGNTNSNVHKIRYHMISNIEDISNNMNQDICEHIITYNDNIKEHVKFNKKDENTFKLRYEYMLMNRPVVNIKYLDISIISKYIKEDREATILVPSTCYYIFNIIDKNNVKTKYEFNSIQMSLFLKLFKLLNQKEYTKFTKNN